MDQIIKSIKENIDVKESLLKNKHLIEKIKESIDKTLLALKNGKKILFCGNGGSAADAQHLAAELLGKMYIDREPLLAISLTTNTSSITAIANDVSYEEVFYRQIKALGNSGDVLISLSTSGNSKSIVKAMEYATSKKILTIALTGQSGGEMKEFADILINVPSKITARIQESHILIGHIICETIEKELFNSKK